MVEYVIGVFIELLFKDIVLVFVVGVVVYFKGCLGDKEVIGNDGESDRIY